MPKYYLLNRPPGIGCQPGGFVNSEVWMPSQQCGIENRYAFGHVSYAVELSLNNIYKFELLPDSIVERAAYYFYIDNDKDCSFAIFDIEEHMALRLSECNMDDYKVNLLISVLAEGHTLTEVVDVLRKEMNDEVSSVR